MTRVREAGPSPCATSRSTSARASAECSGQGRYSCGAATLTRVARPSVAGRTSPGDRSPIPVAAPRERVSASRPDRAHSVTPDFPSARTRCQAAPPSRSTGLIPAVKALRESRPP